MVAVATIVVAGRSGQVAANPGSIRDRRATTGVDIDIRAVVDGAATNGDRAPAAGTEVTNPYYVALVATRVDLVDHHDAAIGAGASNPTIAGRCDVATRSEAVPAVDQAPQPAATVVAVIAAGDRGQVVTTARGITDSRAPAGVDIDIRAVIDVAAVDGGRSTFTVGATTDIAGANRIPLVVTRVDLTDDHDAAVGAGIGASTVAGRRAVTISSAVQRRDAASGQTHVMPVALALAVVIPATAVIAATVVVAFSLAIDASIAVPTAIVGAVVLVVLAVLFLDGLALGPFLFENADFAVAIDVGFLCEFGTAGAGTTAVAGRGLGRCQLVVCGFGCGQRHWCLAAISSVGASARPASDLLHLTVGARVAAVPTISAAAIAAVAIAAIAATIVAITGGVT